MDALRASGPRRGHRERTPDARSASLRCGPLQHVPRARALQGEELQNAPAGQDFANSSGMEMPKRSAIAILVLLLVTAGCTREVKQTTENTATRVAEKVEDAVDIATPLGTKDDPAAREKE